MYFLNDDTKKIEGPITLGKVKAAIDSLKSGKTTGPDDLGGEFYKNLKNNYMPSAT